MQEFLARELVFHPSPQAIIAQMRTAFLSQIVLSKFWKVDLNHRVARELLDLHETLGKLFDLY